MEFTKNAETMGQLPWRPPTASGMKDLKSKPVKKSCVGNLLSVRGLMWNKGSGWTVEVQKVKLLEMDPPESRVPDRQES